MAQASLVDRAIEPVEAVSWDEAVAATASYPGLTSHPFPDCFACGLQREDGLRIFPGEVPPASEGQTRLAAPWVPDPTVAADYPRVRRPRTSCLPGRHLVGAGLHRWMGR